MSHFTSFIGVIVLAIVPTQSRDATRSIIVKRGVVTFFEIKTNEPKLKLTDKIKDRSPIAVLPIEVPAGGEFASQRTGVMNSILSDLRYMPNFLVLDRSEILASASPAVITEATVASAASTLGARIVITGSLSADGDMITIELKYFSAKDGTSTCNAVSKASGQKNDIYAVEDKALLGLLAQVNLTPDAEHLAQIKKIPTKNFAARSKADEGYALLDQLVRKDGKRHEQFVAINDAAKKLAQEALKADRKRYVLAHMLLASCLYNLNPDPTRASDELKTCLADATKVNYPERIDTIRGLELQGDEATFSGNHKEAIKAYEQILEFDPGNLPALWTLSCLCAGDFGTSDDQSRASRYASQLILTHPKSIAASRLTTKAP